MRDVVFVLITIGFFAIAAAFVGACAKIIGPDEITTAELDAEPATSDGATAALR